jgi:hypothetical protein
MWNPDQVTPSGMTLGETDRAQARFVEEANQALGSLAGSGAQLWKYSVSHRKCEILVGDSLGECNVVLCFIVCELLSGPVKWQNQRLRVQFESAPPENDRAWCFTLVDDSVGFCARSGGFLWRRNFDLLRNESPCFGYDLGMPVNAEPGAPPNGGPRMTAESINHQSGEGPKKPDEAQTEAQLSHDKEIFQRVNAIADEKALKSICHYIIVFRFYDKQQLNTLYKLNRFGELIENQFLNRALKVSYSLFHVALREMMNVAMMIYLTEGDRYVLYPGLQNSEEGTESRKLYDDAAAAVDKAVDNALKSYRSFRQLVKSTLYI